MQNTGHWTEQTAEEYGLVVGRVMLTWISPIYDERMKTKLNSFMMGLSGRIF
jgi:hypothetical protein